MNVITQRDFAEATYSVMETLIHHGAKREDVLLKGYETALSLVTQDKSLTPPLINDVLAVYNAAMDMLGKQTA